MLRRRRFGFGRLNQRVAQARPGGGWLDQRGQDEGPMFHVKHRALVVERYYARNAARSASRAGFGLAPMTVLTTSPFW
jgi:hypothetical protein